MKKEFICIVCPKGCHITVEDDKVSGNSCPRGEVYVRQEMTNPTRTLTSTVKVDDYDHPVCPVKSEDALPKGLIFKAMEELNKITLSKPVAFHQIVIENIFDTGVNIVTTKEIK